MAINKIQMSHIKIFFATVGLLLLTLVQPLVGEAQDNHGAAPGKCWVYIGTYTRDGSKGIYLYQMDLASGELTSRGLAAETPNPTFLDVDAPGKFLYAADEISHYEGKAAGKVCAFSIDADTGKLTLLNERTSGGDGPCHVLLDHSGKNALIANYGGGSVEVLPIGTDGRLGEPSAFIQHSGKSINPDRQEKPHAHSMALDPDNHFAFACDLGMDKLMIYHFDADHGTLTPGQPPFIPIKAGSGPRHMTFSADGHIVYLINELTSTISVFGYDAQRGVMHLRQTVSALPDDFKGKNTDAEIVLHPSGKFLYGSNRGDDTIVLFAIDPVTGMLTFRQRQPVQGKTPRNFAIDPTGKFLLDANQDSNNLVLFSINPQNGMLTPTGKTWDIAAPVCVKFVPVTGK